ncbi:NADP-dependent oxidoreductase domain-containing protein [Phakopsora pachyrhizi]|uniref:NADP-dependent oxidoreductase domain-containing protein n=1 Tax=Phakopsora pachyrhizi TaxID=170000 RepID=A0AAV0BVT2_PHAPC|nr:NADP-dependent oxidoreductase domain-containing protein [Phakopsora pachyrhizi]
MSSNYSNPHPLIKLADGVEMPQIGLGTWLSEPNQVKNAVSYALRNGYRHLDLAKVYENQDEVADGIKQSGVKRHEIFITSKLWNSWHRPDKVSEGLEDTLRELQLDYLDLYLIHWPVSFVPPKDPTKLSTKEILFPTKPEDKAVAELDLKNSIAETWKEMVKLQKSGKVKAIGVSNFTIQHLEDLIKATGVTPAVNQIERHPLLVQTDLVNYCNSKGIHITAYSPLGNNLLNQTKIVDYPEVKEMAKKYSADPAQVLISWGAKGGISVIPKSINPKRIDSNFKLVDLSDEDYKTLSNLGKGKQTRFNVPITYSIKWDINVFDEEIEKSASHKVAIF